MQVMIERTREDVAKLAADIGYGACLVGHEGLGVAQLFEGHDAGTATFASTRPRRLDTLAGVPADKARPTGSVVSIGEWFKPFSATDPRVDGRAGDNGDILAPAARCFRFSLRSRVWACRRSAVVGE